MTITMLARSFLRSIGLLAPASNLRVRCLNWLDQRATANLYRSFLSPNDLCFDLGANIGNVSDVLLRLGAKVVALEPQAENAQALQARFSGNHNFILVPMAVAAEVGEADLMVCDVSLCSSLSSDFVAAVKQSGRLNLDLCKWNEVRRVPTTTLDELIREYGMPAFVKIDVEGFEDEVMRGCSRRLRALSFEFTPERLQPALNCIDRLETLGPIHFNYTVEGRKILQLETWVDGTALKEILKSEQFRVTLTPAGDIYGRFAE